MSENCAGTILGPFHFSICEQLSKKHNAGECLPALPGIIVELCGNRYGKIYVGDLCHGFCRRLNALAVIGGHRCYPGGKLAIEHEQGVGIIADEF